MKRIIYILLLLCCSVSAIANDPDPALLKKAQAGDAAAQYKISCFYLPTMKSESEEGVKWLIKAAENGHARAQWELDDAYASGGLYGLPKDDEKRAYWLTKLANNTDLENYKSFITSAQNTLGELYMYGLGGFEKNISEYLKWEKKAAYNGYYPAAFSLGLYYEGEGDKQEAIYWLKKGMDLCWADRQEEDEYAVEKLKELGVTYHPADHVGHNHTGSTASTATTGGKDGLLAEGTYTISGQGRSLEHGYYTQGPDPDSYVTIEFYDDHIVVCGQNAKYIGTSGGEKKYEERFDFGSLSTISYYYVDSNYNVRLIRASGSGYFEYPVKKGELNLPRVNQDLLEGFHNSNNSNSYSRPSVNGSGHNHNHNTYQKTCPQCGGSGKCRTCNGTHYYINPLTNKRVECPNCRPDGKCSSCNGTGKK